MRRWPGGYYYHYWFVWKASPQLTFGMKFDADLGSGLKSDHTNKTHGQLLHI